MPFLGKTPSQFVDPEVDIDGGSIDGTAIGATSASTATVTTFTSTGIDDNATSTAITIDSSENVGMGTSSPSGNGPLSIEKDSQASCELNISLTNGTSNKECIVNFGKNLSTADRYRGRIFYQVDNDVMGFWTAGANERMRIDASGRVGIGLTPSHKLDVNNTAATHNVARFNNQNASYNTDVTLNHSSATGNFLVSRRTNGEAWLYHSAAHSTVFHVSGSEVMRVASNQSVLVGKSSPGVSSYTGFEILKDGWMSSTVATSSNNSYHMYNLASNAYLFYVKGNGGINNVQGNNVNLSDERSKKGIVDSGEWLNKLCQIPVRNFRYKHEDDSGKIHLGVVSQEVEAVAPELVEKNSFEIDGEGRDSVYTGDLQFAMLKAIQEQQAIIDSQASAIADLTTRLEALEAN